MVVLTFFLIRSYFYFAWDSDCFPFSLYFCIYTYSVYILISLLLRKGDRGDRGVLGVNGSIFNYFLFKFVTDWQSFNYLFRVVLFLFGCYEKQFVRLWLSERWMAAILVLWFVLFILLLWLLLKPDYVWTCCKDWRRGNVCFDGDFGINFYFYFYFYCYFWCKSWSIVYCPSFLLLLLLLILILLFDVDDGTSKSYILLTLFTLLAYLNKWCEVITLVFDEDCESLSFWSLLNTFILLVFVWEWLELFSNNSFFFS